MTIDSRSRLAENLNSVREAIQSACSRSGRVSQEVTLVAVTKYAQFEWVQDLVELGVTDLGEARPQQLVLRADSFREDVRWHLIGHLQRNKAEDVLRVNCLIHSVDSLRLLSHLDQLGAKRGRVPNVLLEINVSGEASKDGFDPEELIAAWPEVCRNQTIEIAGLMTMAPLHEDSERTRPVFRRLRELRDRLRIDSAGRWPLHHLSMGMSGDFEVAIEEGATMVRIGSRLFDGLQAESH